MAVPERFKRHSTPNSLLSVRLASLAAMNVPLILRDEPFTEPTPIAVPADIATVTEFSEAATLADLPSIFDSGYALLATAGPIGPGYAIYAGDPRGVFDLEIGFPVAAGSIDPDPESGGAFTANTFPAGSALALTHLGAYDTLGDSWARLMQHFVEKGLGAPRLTAEIYVGDPSVTTAADLRTDLLVFY